MSARTTLLAALSVMVFTCPAFAEEPTPQLEGNLIHTSVPLHITVNSMPAGFDPRVEAGNPDKATIAPRVKCSSSILTNPVYDVSAWFRTNGGKLPTGSEVLFSPRANLFYIYSTKDDLELAESMIWPATVGGALWTMDIRVSLYSHKKEEILFEASSVPILPVDRQLEFTVSTGKKSVRLQLAPIIGPDTYTVQTELVAEAHVSGSSLKMKSVWTTHVAESAETTLGSLGNATVRLRMKTRLETEYWGPDYLTTPVKKAKAIKEIQMARERDRTP